MERLAMSERRVLDEYERLRRKYGWVDCDRCKHLLARLISETWREHYIFCEIRGKIPPPKECEYFEPRDDGR